MSFVGMFLPQRLSDGFVQTFHFEMLQAIAGLRDMINQTPGFESLITGTQVGSTWQHNSATPRKRGNAALDEEDFCLDDAEMMLTPSAEPSSLPINPSTPLGLAAAAAESSQTDVFARLESLASKHSWFFKDSSPTNLSGKHCWADLLNESDIKVRGPSYLDDKQKINANGCLMPVVCMELYPCEGFKTNICAHPKGFVQKVAKQEWGPDGPPFIFCVQFFVPCSSPNNYMLNIYCAEDPAADANGRRVLQRFMDGDKEEQYKKFKLIPRVAEGGWFVKKACGDPPTPAIMGTKVKQICTKAPHYFEVDFDLGASSVAGGIVKVVLGPAKTLVVDLAFLVESQTQDELPENLLMATRLSRIDLPNADGRKSPYEGVAFNMTRS